MYDGRMRGEVCLNFPSSLKITKKLRVLFFALRRSFIRASSRINSLFGVNLFALRREFQSCGLFLNFCPKSVVFKVNIKLS